MLIVDTSVWIDYFNGKITEQTEKLDFFLSNSEVGIGDLILVEVLQGFRNDNEYLVARSLLMDLELKPLCSVDLAVKSAENYRLLRKRGITIRKTIDSLIATYCLENKLALLFSDRDFDPWCEHFSLIDASRLLKEI